MPAISTFDQNNAAREASRRLYLADGISRFVMDLVTNVETLERERDALLSEREDLRRRIAALETPVCEPGTKQGAA